MSFFCVVNSKKFKNVIINCLIFCAVLVVFCATIVAGGVQTTSLKAEKLTPIYKGDEASESVSIMINVYWGNEYIEPMLKTLEENGVKATFFIGGSWANKNEALFDIIVKGGHEIGNHGYLHKDCAKLGENEIKEEIEKTNAIIKAKTSKDCVLFAPPSGSFNQKTLEIAKGLNMKTIMWSKDTIDWRDKDESVIFERATKGVSAGDLILMHPTKATMQALDKIIKEIKAKNLSLCEVSNNLEK